MRAVITLAILAIGANAVELSIEPGALSPGKPLSLALKLATGADAPTGIQFDLEYDAASLDIAIEAGPAAAQAGKNLRAAKTAAGTQRVLIIGFNRNAMTDGVLARLRITCLGQAAGRTFPIHITAASATNRKAETVPVTGKDGGVKVESEGNGQ